MNTVDLDQTAFKGQTDQGLLCLPVHHDMGLDVRKPVFTGFVNNTGADQPAHPRSLISAFVIHVLESILCKLATKEISIF